MSKVCERIETRRSCKSIETEISKLKRHIQREEPHIDEKEAVAQEYTTKIDLYRKTMKSIREHKMALKVKSRLSVRVEKNNLHVSLIYTCPNTCKSVVG